VAWGGTTGRIGGQSLKDTGVEETEFALVQSLKGREDRGITLMEQGNLQVNPRNENREKERGEEQTSSKSFQPEKRQRLCGEIGEPRKPS